MFHSGLFIDQNPLNPFEFELGAFALADRVGHVVLYLVQLLAGQGLSALILHVLSLITIHSVSPLAWKSRCSESQSSADTLIIYLTRV